MQWSYSRFQLEEKRTPISKELIFSPYEEEHFKQQIKSCMKVTGSLTSQSQAKKKKASNCKASYKFFKTVKTPSR